ncbi:MAG: hypothetical protein F4213_02160 [Boseongicola sp. SB0677_bin_26]|nr:hypothetical protein [Boseongicola sp. SB0665_bin_10]MYG24820.1 hypothetical protein [Boseongicola sp. SB0677_bin_26]
MHMDSWPASYVGTVPMFDCLRKHNSRRPRASPAVNFSEFLLPSKRLLELGENCNQVGKACFADKLLAAIEQYCATIATAAMPGKDSDISQFPVNTCATSQRDF